MMFREKSISKLYTFALAAVFALTLAGCGGNGGGSSMMNGDDNGDEELTDAEKCTAAGGATVCADGGYTCTTAEMMRRRRSCQDRGGSGGYGSGGTKAEVGCRVVSSKVGGSDAGPYRWQCCSGEMLHLFDHLISRDNDGTTVTITDTANADADDPQIRDARWPPWMGDLGDWAGSMHVRTMDADDDGDVEQEVVIVRTDIEAPTATPFTTEHGGTGVYA